MGFLATEKGTRNVSAIADDGLVRLGLLDSERLFRDLKTVSPRLKELIALLTKQLRKVNNRVCKLVTRAK